MKIKREDRFPDDFVWGAATASYQIEGSRLADGGGESVWDVFSRRPGAVLGGMNGDLACDSWRRWKDDIALLRGLGVDAYRFSLSWARIVPKAGGGANRAALDWYRRFIEALLMAGIEPWITLYHWDHPAWVEEAGGWPARDTAFRFADYATLCFGEFGDLANKWISLNEPWCSSILSHDLGEHAPGHRDKAAAYRAVHHLLLGHGLATEAFRASPPRGTAAAGRKDAGAAQIGITLNPSLPRPATRREEDILAASRAGDQRTALFMDPLFGKGYPEGHLAAYPGIVMPIVQGDLEKIAMPIDFLGVNYYNEDVVEAVAISPEHPEGFRRVPSWEDESDMGWAVSPGGMKRLLSGLHERWKPKALVVTENGYASRDEPDASGRVADRGRIDYLRGHIGSCEEALVAGIPLKGYFEWSLMDNFEWAWGYSKRFGIVHVDFRSQERRPKDSYYWYRDVVAGHGWRS
ncbi:MAG TPA: GH1 family beta-glucosidase [Rectinemataceae bacterium]|nr:GH1 family beta-glucosidase [Rectinemataceae bacterium]